jgi:hypothetical protein
MIGRRPDPSAISVRSVLAQRRVMWVLSGGVITVVGLVLIAFGRSSSVGASIALFVLLGAIVAAGIRPILGVYAIVFFTLIGDGVTSEWFPFAKNLSAQESLLYLSNQAFLSPLEILVVATLLFFVIGRIGAQPRQPLVKGPMFWAIAVFTLFVLFGLMHGLARGGDPRIALYEGRHMFLLFPVYLLIVNLCDRDALRRLAWTAVAAIFINALLALLYLSQLSPLERESLESLGEHASAVHWNVLILLPLVAFLYRSTQAWTRLVLLGMLVPVGIAYLAAQRRASVAGLVAAVAVVLLALWWENRAKFMVIVPILALVTAGYTAAFWNSQSTVGFPAQAIKTIIAPDSVSENDQGSDQYRQTENFDLNFTIRAAPIVGLGFGHQFLRPIELPDISFFEFYKYIPHNSILWIWVKTGFFGFASMLLMFAVAMRGAGRTIISRDDPAARGLALIGLCYVLMYVIYAFVDIGWDPRSMVFLTVCFALCSQLEREETASHDEAEDDASRLGAPATA